MNLGPCPHCGIGIRQSRSDGRCVGCGQLLPDELRASPEPSTPLPDEAIYRDFVAKLIDRGKAVGYELFEMINDLRARWLVLKLDVLGGANLLRLILDRIGNAFGRVQTENLAAAWDFIVLTYGRKTVTTAPCPHCGTTIVQLPKG